MKKFWQLVSKRDLVFVSLLFVAVIILSIFESANKVKVSFGDTAVDIKSAKYSMNIPYEMVSGIDLVPLEDAGEVIEGADDMAGRTGLWKNEAWGEYYICADLDVQTCIAVHLDDGRLFVFSRKDAESTEADYQEFLSHLES